MIKSAYKNNYYGLAMQKLTLKKAPEGESGQTLVEFALLLPLIVVVLLAIMEFGAMFYVNLTMQNAVRQGARYAVTGQTQAGFSRRASLENKIRFYSNGLYDKHPHTLTTSKVTPGSSTYTNLTGAQVGKGGDIIMVQLDYTWPLMTPVLKPFFRNNKYVFTVKATMANELF